MASLNLRQIRKQYDGGKPVIDGLDLDIRNGEFMVFVGPSGCGKTTLLRMIAGLEDITDGELTIDGRLANSLSPNQRGIAMVFQSYALYPHMTVGENMGFALKLAGASREDIKAAIGRAAEILQISHLLDRKPSALSGGQRQRVAIGRAIVRKPKVFLFDEPLSNLDAALRVQMRIELERLHQELKATMIYVTHDQVEAMTMGDRVAVFNHGRIEQVGSPLTLYREPANRFVAGFLGSPQMNFIEAEVSGASGGMLDIDLGGDIRVQLPGSLPVGTRATLGIRPEDLTFSPDGQGIPVMVDLVEHLGDSTIVYGSLGRHEGIAARLPPLAGGIGKGSCIGLLPRRDTLHLFDSQGHRLC
jgi:multiple sugar transport system ATP-binding protein